MALPSRNMFRIAAAIFVVALVIRTGYIVTHPRPPFSDEQEYRTLALSLASTGSYSIDGVPTAYRPVGYPFLLSMVFRISDDSILAGKVVQGVLDSFIAFLLVLMAREGTKKHALMAGLMWSIFPPAVLYTNLLLSETATACLLTVLAYIFLTTSEQTSYSIMMGVTLGLLILIKPFLCLFALLFIAYQFRRVAKKQIIALLGSVLVITLPWAFRNLLTVREFTLSTNTGLNLFIGNNPHTTGAYSGQFPTELADSNVDEATLEARGSHLALKFIADHPVQFCANGIKKIAHLFRGEAELAVLAFHPDPSSRQSSFAEKYRSLTPFVRLLPTIPYFIVTLLTLIRLIVGPIDRIAAFFLLLLISLLAVHFVFFGGSRFHFVLLPFAVYLATHQLFSLSSTLPSLHRMKLGLLAVVGCGFCTIWIYEFVYLAGH